MENRENLEGRASFRVRLQQRAWVVEEETHGVGGIFGSLVAALQFAAMEARQLGGAQTVIEVPGGRRDDPGRTS